MKKRIISLIMVVALCVVSFSFSKPFDTTASAKTKSELQSEIANLDSQIKSYKSKLAELEDDKQDNEEYLATLEKQISAVEEKASNLETQIQTIDNEITGYNNQITQLNNEIDVIQGDITSTKKEIKETEGEIDNAKDGLSKQLKTAYIQGKESTLKILMGADSLASFLTSLELMKKTSEAENKVINSFKDQVTKLKAAKNKLEEKKSSLDTKVKEVEDTKALAVERKNELVTKQQEYKSTISEIEADYSKVDKYISELDRNSAIYKSYISKAESARQEADAELDKVISNYYATSHETTTGTTLHANNNNNTTASSGSSGGSGSYGATTVSSYPSSASWAWPLGSTSCYISSGYGYRSASISGNAFHGGIDITGGGIYGKPVYASRAGKVVTAVYGSTGYGRYVVIDHGDGFTTVYGHCSNLCVSAGQTVSKGQQIAYVGSTGNSTGPHLHFEVRHNGTKQNPLSYVSKP